MALGAVPGEAATSAITAPVRETSSPGRLARSSRSALPCITLTCNRCNLKIASMRTKLSIVLCLALAGAASAESLQVFAASSLSESFKELGNLYQTRHGVTPAFNFAATNELRQQIEHGASADVFAAASQEEMDKAVQAGLVEAPRVFARNRLVLIVPRSNPGRIKSLRDLARPSLKLVTTHPNVPAGKYTRCMLDRLAADPAYGAAFRDRVRKNFVSLEINVKQVCGKVSLGEADGGICYSSDVTARLGQTVTALAIPVAYNVDATYPIAVLARARQAAAARRFVEFVTSAPAQKVLATYNFGPATR